MNLNQFAHLSPREWYGTDFLLADAPQVRDPYCSDQTSAKYVFQISSCHDSSFTKNNSAPDNIDWRQTGAVLPVINQGSLGKSAYFATTDTVASIWYRKTGHLVPLSVQQLSDCSKNYFDLYQFNYIIDAKGYYDANMIIFEYFSGIESAKDYVSDGGKCNFDIKKVTAQVQACYTIKKGDENALKVSLTFDSCFGYSFLCRMR